MVLLKTSSSNLVYLTTILNKVLLCFFFVHLQRSISDDNK